jgi:nitrate/TMAO reductase-like tetraheme cytochrome c subunit
LEHPITPLGYACLVCVAGALLIISRYMWRPPALDFRTKIWLLLGLGILPGMAAATSTATGMHATTERHFCGSCHTMDEYVSDASDPNSQSLAARHGRNPFFGGSNCYVCHADYGMLGYPMTKLNGMRHVYMYYLGGWKGLSTEEVYAKIHLNKPYDNQNCRQCHTGTLADWATVPEHVALAAELEANTVSCASSGCHGYAHPFSKDDGGGASALPRSALGSDKPDAAIPSALSEAERERIQALKDAGATEVQARAEAVARRREAAREAARKAARARSASSSERAP